MLLAYALGVPYTIKVGLKNLAASANSLQLKQDVDKSTEAV